MHAKRKLDFGKSCNGFKKVEEVSFALIGALCRKITVEDWIKLYESSFNNK